MTTTPTDTQVRDLALKLLADQPDPLRIRKEHFITILMDVVRQTRAADRAYLAGEIEKLKGVDVTDSNPMISRGVVPAFINTTQK